MPVFAIFFPVDIAIAMTAVVHFLNNLFKLTLIGKFANKNVIMQFGIPAILSAFVGAQTLVWVSHVPALLSYNIMGHRFSVMPVKVLIAILMIFFALFEIIPALQNLSFGRKYLSIGGVLSGFFGGLSGHQGALRSAFLIKCNLSKESFIASGTAIACMVDIARMFIYFSHFIQGGDYSISNLFKQDSNVLLLFLAVFFAFCGALLGNIVIKKVTMRFIKIIVSTILFIIALGLGSGILD